ncbi:MAG: hypothetical protein FVQ82_12765 [Planctomycetes bacterium]|nr:hypothetical protein [Planctomycetota bacterium]
MSIEKMINKVKQEVKHDVESIKSMSHLPKPTISAAPSGPYDPSAQPDPSEPSDDREHLHEKRKSIDNHVHKKIIEISDRLHKYLPTFESAGYKLKKFEVELGISPKIIPHFMIDESVTLEQKMEALEKVKGKRMMHLMMEALIKASKLHGTLQVGDLDFCGIEVHLSAIPTVRLLFGSE